VKRLVSRNTETHGVSAHLREPTNRVDAARAVAVRTHDPSDHGSSPAGPSFVWAVRSWEPYWFARVADSVRIGSERYAWHSQRRRPWLRLIRTDLEDLGPVSPELVLVDPPLAATVRLTPDAVVVQNGHVGDGIQPARPADLELPEVGRAVATRRRRPATTRATSCSSGTVSSSS